MVLMSLTISFTKPLALQHPIALAPMGGSTDGALAAAVSNGGGLSLVGGSRSDREWLQRELALVTRQTAGPWGVRRSQLPRHRAAARRRPRRDTPGALVLGPAPILGRGWCGCLRVPRERPNRP